MQILKGNTAAAMKTLLLKNQCFDDHAKVTFIMTIEKRGLNTAFVRKISESGQALVKWASPAGLKDDMPFGAAL